MNHPKDRAERLRLKELHEHKKKHASKIRRRLREELILKETDDVIKEIGDARSRDLLG